MSRPARNPLREPWRSSLSRHDAEMLDAAERRLRALHQQIEAAYDAGNVDYAELLDEEADVLAEKLESMAAAVDEQSVEEHYGEDERATLGLPLDEDLAQLYERVPRAELAGAIRRSWGAMHPAVAQATDDQLVEMAHDARDARRQHVERYRDRARSSLVRNAPIGRLEYVIKTYKDSAYSVIIIDTVTVALHTLGKDSEVNAFLGDYVKLHYYLQHRAIEELRLFVHNAPCYSGPDECAHWEEDIDLVPGDGGLAVVGSLPYGRQDLRIDVTTRAGREQALTKAWALMAEGLRIIVPRRHEHDFIIPWVARELLRLRKAAAKHEVAMADYHDAVVALERQGTAIAMWAKDNRIDLTKTTLAEALEASKEYEREVDDVPQGEVVYEFDDGWTVQRLATAEQLEVEGEAMQHCVGSGAYWDAVKGLRSVVFSLRDPGGYPHATMEWKPRITGGTAWEDAGRQDSGLKRDWSKLGHMEQVQGKQNEPPLEKYLVRLREFAAERFPGDAAMQLLLGADPQTLDLADADLIDADLRDASLPGVDLTGANLHGANLVGADLTDADLTGANLADADLTGANLHGANLRGVHLHGADLTGANLTGANLRYANLTGATLRHANLTGADLLGTRGL